VFLLLQGESIGMRGKNISVWGYVNTVRNGNKSAYRKLKGENGKRGRKHLCIFL
jgi:hypothetical protein